MKTITLYHYEDLSEESKAKAVEEIREEMESEESQEAVRWAIDDCALFEPAHAEMTALFGEDYYERNGGQFVFKNNRKGIEYEEYFETVQIAEPLEITNSTMFKTWLGIPEIFQEDLEIDIEDYNGRTTLFIENPFPSEDPRHEVLNDILTNAVDKFEAHVSSIGKRIASSVEEYFSDENVIERILEGEYTFSKNGKLFEVNI